MKNKTRPTTQKIREAIFNILSDKIKDAVFLDLFAGSGMVGIDAYLYGAKQVYLVENNYNVVRTIKQNIENAGAREPKPLQDIVLIKKDALLFLEETPEKFDIVFIDPPYETSLGDESLKIIDDRKLLNKGGVIIFEHYHKKEFGLKLDNIFISEQRKYGQTKLTFWR